VGLDIDEDARFERRYYRAQRIAWVVMLAIVGLALAGLFGGGPISSYVVQGRGPLALDAVLPRFSRYSQSETGTMRISADIPRGATQMAVSISRGLLDLIGPVRIEPAPGQARQSAAVVTYVFDLDGAGGRVGATITFQPHAAGLAWGIVRVEAGGLASEVGPLWTFVFP